MLRFRARPCRYAAARVVEGQKPLRRKRNMADQPSPSAYTRSPLPDLIRSGSEDSGSSVSTLSSAESPPGIMPQPTAMTMATLVATKTTDPHYGFHAVDDPYQISARLSHRRSQCYLSLPFAPSDLLSEVSSSALGTQANRFSSPDDSPNIGGVLCGRSDQSRAANTHTPNLAALQQAANYVSFSQTPSLSSSSALSERFDDLNIASKFRPTMARMVSSLTARPLTKSNLSVASSAAATPAALVVEDPMEKASNFEGLEKDVESPSCSFSGGWQTEAEAMCDSPAVPLRAAMEQALSSSLSSSSAIRASEDIVSAARVASPDSWRSLLPEHDPYYASEAVLAESQQRHKLSSFGNDGESDHGGLKGPLRPAYTRDDSRESTTSQSAASHNGWSSCSRSLSNSSMASIQTTFSLPTPSVHKSPVQAHNFARESWRSLLPESDPASELRERCGRDSTSSSSDESSVTGAAVRKESGPNLSRFTGTIGVSANQTQEITSPSRRHASFSTFDRADQGQTIRFGSDFGHGYGEYHLRARPQGTVASVIAASLSGRDSPQAFACNTVSDQNHKCSESGLISQPQRLQQHSDSQGTPQSLTSVMLPPQSTSKAAMEDAEERERWPSSRVSRDAMFLQRALAVESASSCMLRSPVQTERLLSTEPPTSSRVVFTQESTASVSSRGIRQYSSQADTAPEETPQHIEKDIRSADLSSNITSQSQKSSAYMSPSGGSASLLNTTTTTTTSLILPSTCEPLGVDESSADMNYSLSGAVAGLSESQPIRPYVVGPEIRTHDVGLDHGERSLQGNTTRSDVTVHVAPTRYTIFMSLPGLAIEDIVISSAGNNALSISVRDSQAKRKWKVYFSKKDGIFDFTSERDGGDFGIRAEFDGVWLVVKVPRRLHASVSALAAPFESSSPAGLSISSLSSNSASSAKTTIDETAHSARPAASGAL